MWRRDGPDLLSRNNNGAVTRWAEAFRQLGVTWWRYFVSKRTMMNVT